MLKKLQKLFTNVGDNPAAAAVNPEKEAEEMALTAEQTALAATNTQALAELNAQFVQAQESLTALQAANADLVSKLAAIETEKQAVVKAAKDAKLATRKEKIVAAVGAAKADALLTATEGLADASFDAIVAAMQVNLDAEASTSLFTEAGVSGETDKEAVNDSEKPAHFNQFLKKAAK